MRPSPVSPRERGNPLTKSCFVIMPIGDQEYAFAKVTSRELRERYDDFIKEALLKARPGLGVVRGDESDSPGTITTDILTRLMHSDYVVADITYPNPNVFYELGIRHACRLGTVLLKDRDGPPLPFDVSHMRYIPYEYTPSGLKTLVTDLQGHLDWIDNNAGAPDNAFQELAKLTQYKFLSYDPKVYPPVIEAAIDEQLYALNFYKERVAFTLHVNDVRDDDVEFTTELSYLVTNRTTEHLDWVMEYKFKYDRGSVLEVRFNNQPIDTTVADIKSGRGVSIRQRLRPREKASVYFKIRERFRKQDYELYTSYHPATDLSLTVYNPFASLVFDYEVFYFTNVWPVRSQDRTEIHFDKGILPHQGVRLNWKGV